MPEARFSQKSAALITHLFSNEEETAEFAAKLARTFQPGDCLLLSGPVGSGKSHFARSAIRSLLLILEDIPSPTFTLVQTYDTSVGEIWHCDLYRLSHPDEVFELGLADAMESAVCLIEWPDRLGAGAPANALHLEFSATSTLKERVIAANCPDDRWAHAVQSSLPA